MPSASCKLIVEKYNLTNKDVSQGIARDMICPHCGAREKFLVGLVGQIVVFCNGTWTEMEEVEIAKDDFVKCLSCEEDGVKEDFTVTGLDDYLETL
jgi:hypothetical protein